MRRLRLLSPLLSRRCEARLPRTGRQPGAAGHSRPRGARARFSLRHLWRAIWPPTARAGSGSPGTDAAPHVRGLQPDQSGRALRPDGPTSAVGRRAALDRQQGRRPRPRTAWALRRCTLIGMW